VAAVADTTIVVLTPNLGDGVQMIKAGILEIADIFVVNKADLEGSNRAVTELRGMLSLSKSPPALRAGTPRVWKPPIIPTSAARQEGIDKLWEAVLAHRRHLESSGREHELARQRLEDETAEVAAEIARDRVRRALAEDPSLAERLLADGTPYGTAEEILDRKR
jgi:LAO/AO transport system kinase